MEWSTNAPSLDITVRGKPAPLRAEEEALKVKQKFIFESGDCFNEEFRL